MEARVLFGVIRKIQHTGTGEFILLEEAAETLWNIPALRQLCHFVIRI